jgi:shikimate dehydrogenase
VVVLGAGGAARAVVATLVGTGVPELRLINRTQKSAIDLGVAFTPNDGRRIAIERWDERDVALDGATLLVNTTSLGMKGQPPLEIDRPPASQRGGRRHRLCAAGDRSPAVAQARAASAASISSTCCCTSRGLRGVVRPEGT